MIANIHGAYITNPKWRKKRIKGPVHTEVKYIITKEQIETLSIDELNKIINDNPQESNALIITAIFLVIGLIFSYFYPKDQRGYILATVLIISAVLIYIESIPIIHFAIIVHIMRYNL